MNIAPIAPVVIPAIKLDTLVAIDANTTSSGLQSVSILPDAHASAVNFSTLAQLLAATVVFQTQEAQQAKALSDGSLSTSNFSQLAATATFFVDAFNRFQTSVDSLGNPVGAAFDTAFLLAIHTQNVQLGSDHAQSFIDSLAQVGIRFQEASDASNPNQFKIDSVALEAAFAANPEQTTRLLENALKGLSAIEAKLLVAAPNLGLDLFASDVNQAEPDRVPASTFDENGVTAKIATLSSADAQIVNSALQHMLADEALSAAMDANPITPQSESEKINITGDTSANSAKRLLAENPSIVLNSPAHSAPVQASFAGNASLMATQIAEADKLNNESVAPGFSVENGVTAASLEKPAAAVAGNQVAANSAQSSILFPAPENLENKAVLAGNVAEKAIVKEAATTANEPSLSTQQEEQTPKMENVKRPTMQSAGASRSGFAPAPLPNTAAASVAPALATPPGIVAPTDRTGDRTINMTRRMGDTTTSELTTGTDELAVTTNQLKLPLVFADEEMRNSGLTATPNAPTHTASARQLNSVTGNSTGAGQAPAVTSPSVFPSKDLATPVSVATPPTTSTLGRTTLDTADSSVGKTPAHLEAAPSNPLIAAAVAAYRIGESIASTARDEVVVAASEVIPDVSVIPRIEAVKLDPHDGNSDDGRNQAALDEVKTPDQRAALKVEHAQLAGQSGVDVLV